jgi:hypothetical protein
MYISWIEFHNIPISSTLYQFRPRCTNLVHASPRQSSIARLIQPSAVVFHEAYRQLEPPSGWNTIHQVAQLVPAEARHIPYSGDTRLQKIWFLQDACVHTSALSEIFFPASSQAILIFGHADAVIGQKDGIASDVSLPMTVIVQVMKAASFIRQVLSIGGTTRKSIQIHAAVRPRLLPA